MKKIVLDTSKVDYYINRGLHQKNWYVYEANRIIDLLPEFEGLPVLRVFAVTSMSTSIEANVHLALKALKQWKNNEPFKGYVYNQVLYLNMIRAGKDVPGRKIMSFIKALEGDPNSVVVDIWMTRAFGIIHKRQLGNRVYFRVPSTKEYDAIEAYCRKDAKRLGLEPRQYQAVVWAGIKQAESTISANVSWSDILVKKKGLFNY